MRYEDSLTYTHWWLWYTTWTKWKHSIHDYLFKGKKGFEKIQQSLMIKALKISIQRNYLDSIKNRYENFTSNSLLSSGEWRKLFLKYITR